MTNLQNIGVKAGKSRVASKESDVHPAHHSEVIDLSEFGARETRTGKTMSFYFSDQELARFRELQKLLRYPSQATSTLRAALRIAYLIASKISEGYGVYLEKEGAERLLLKL